MDKPHSRAVAGPPTGREISAARIRRTCGERVRGAGCCQDQEAYRTPRDERPSVFPIKRREPSVPVTLGWPKLRLPSFQD